jgi:hypothetical protein
MSDNLMEVLSELKSEFKCDSEGKAFSSIRGVARLVGVVESSIRESFDSARISNSKLVQKLMEQGFDSARILNFSKEGIPDVAITTILEYYTFDAGARCTEQAKRVYKLVANVGLRVVMQKAVNWQPTEEPKKTKSKLEIDLMIADYLKNLFKLQVALSHDLDWYSKTFPVVYGLVLELPESVDYKHAYHKTALGKASDEFLEIKSEKGVSSKDFQMSKDLTLMMNRMGLAYNKHLQTFKELQAVTDPTQVGKIRKAYYDLLAEFDKLTKIHCEKEKGQTEKDLTIRNQQEQIRRLTSQCENIELKFENVEVLYKQLLKEKNKERKNAKDFNMFPDSFTESDKVAELENQLFHLRIQKHQLEAEVEDLKTALAKEQKAGKDLKKALPPKEEPNVYTLASVSVKH